MHIEKKTLRNIFIGVISCIILYWLLHETERVKAVFGIFKRVLSPFVIGACIAFILNVPMRGFENLLKRVSNKSLRRVLAMFLTVLCVVFILAIVFILLIPQLIETIQSLFPKIYTFLLQMEEYVTEFIENNKDLVSLIDLKSFDWGNIVKQAMDILGNSLQAIFLGAISAIGGLAGALMDAFIAVVFALYCLFQKETLARQGRKLLYAFLPEKAADEIIRIMRLTNSTFSNFLSGQCIEVCILGCLFAASMAIFNMPYIPLVSVLVAVTAFVPVVGAWVGCIFGAFFILVSDPLQAVWFVVMFIVLQQLENNLIYPRVVGTSIGLSGMWVLLAVAIGGEVSGVAGMFLMIPVASVVYTVLREYTNKKLDAMDIDAEKLVIQPPELRKRRNINKQKTKNVKPKDKPSDKQPTENNEN